MVLIGPGGSGKTTLVETLLASAGAIPRAGSVRDGTTVTDFEDAEQSHERSISLALAPLVHQGIKVNLIDTPGYADFVGELRAGLRAADCALFVIAANEGVDAGTRTLWRECAEVGMPRAVVITKLDQARADYDGVLRQAQEAFGDKVMPLYLPIRDGETSPGWPACSPPASTRDDDQRGSLIEAVIEESEDETLMDRYLGGEEIAEDVLVADLEQAVAKASFHPVVPVCSLTGVGCRELLDLATRAFPSPSEHLPPDVFTPAGGRGSRAVVRPGRPTGRRDRQDHERPVRRSAQPGPRLLRHARPGCDGPRLRALHAPSSARGQGTRTTTRTSASAPCPTPSAGPRCPPPAWSPATCARSAG